MLSLMFWEHGYVSPFIGGVLSRPQDQWPDRFSHPFWAEYPYFLPCLIAAAYTLVSLILSMLYLKEVTHLGFYGRHMLIYLPKTLDCSPRSDLVHQSSRDIPPKDTEVRASEHTDDPGKPLPLHMLLTKPVIVSISNYAMLALLDMSAMALIPLVWSTPIELGGLSLSPTSIGLWLATYGCLNGVLQFFLFPRVVGRLGPGRVVLASIVAYVIIYTMFSFENLAARYTISAHGGGTNGFVWLFVVLQLASICITDMGFSEFFKKIKIKQYSASLTETNNDYRLGVYVPSCRSAQQAFARCHEWTSGNGGRYSTYGRPCSGRIIICIFAGK